MYKANSISQESTKVLGQRLLVKLRKKEEKSAGGIYFPQETIDNEHYFTWVGQVEKIGDTCFKGQQFCGAEPWVKVGDWVMFTPYSGVKVSNDEDVYRILEDHTLLIGFESMPTEDWVNQKDMRVLGYRLLIRGDSQTKKTKEGIYLPDETIDNSKFNAATGQVVNMGPSCYKHRLFYGSEPWVKVGDWVSFPRNNKVRIPTHEADYLVVDDQIPLLKFEEKPEGVNYSW